MKKILLVIAFVVASVSFGMKDARAYTVGENVQVLWKGTWYPAKVTQVNAGGTQWFIHYKGYGNDWDEWVGQDRIKTTASSAPVAASFGVGDSVSVLWKGTWYAAHVITVLGGERYRIHYDGYDSSWDENVGPSRIRSR